MIDVANTAGFAVTHLWQSILIAASLMGILVFGKRMSGATRYAVAGVALAASVLGPMAAFLPEAALVRQAKTMLMNMAGADRVAQPQTGRVADAALRPDGTLIVAARLPGQAETKTDAGPTTTTTTVEAETTLPAQMEIVTSQGAAPRVETAAPAVAASTGFRLPHIDLPRISLPKIPLPDLTLPFLAVWALGALAMLVRLGLDLAAAERLLTSARPLQLTGDLKRRMGSVRVSVSPQASGPMAAGVFRPQVILPESALAMLDEPEMAALMEHERAHIERRDIWAALAQRVVLAAFWWSPAMHWVSRRIDEERELACDEAAVARTGDARAFARTLTRHAQSHAWARAPRLAVGAMGPRSQLGRRIRHLIDMAKLGKVPANYSGRLAFAALSLALVTAVVVTPRIAAQTPPKGPAHSPLPPVRPSSAPSAPDAPLPPTPPGELDGKSHGARIIVRGDGDLTPEQEAKIRAALDGIDAKVIIDRGSLDRDIGPEIEAQVEAALSGLDGKFDFNDAEFGARWAEFGAQIGALASQEVLKNLPDIMSEVQRSLDEAGVKSEDDGHGHRIYKLSPEMKAEMDKAMAEAREEMAKAQAEMKAKFGPEWKAKLHDEMEKARAEARSARDKGMQAWALAADASRAGIDSAIQSLEEQLKTRGDTMGPEERRGLERALESMRRMRDRPHDPVRVSVPTNAADATRRLYDAANSCDEDAVAELLAAKADVNGARGPATPLLAAVRNGCEDAAAVLLKAGANANMVGPQGSPLMIAVRNGEEDMVRLLVEHGANANARAPSGDTPLTTAVRDCNEDIVRLLVDRGHADVNLASTSGGKTRSPLAIAEEAECDDCAAILRAKGARL